MALRATSAPATSAGSDLTVSASGSLARLPRGNPPHRYGHNLRAVTRNDGVGRSGGSLVSLLFEGRRGRTGVLDEAVR